MTRARKLLAPVLALGLLAGCSDGVVAGVRDAPAGARPGPGSAQWMGGSVPDIGGAWHWSRVEKLTLPDWVAEGIAGIQPEGPITIARCEASGTMMLDQTGATFTGLETKTSSICTTGGRQDVPPQQFVPPDAFLPVTVSGRIHGRSLRLLLDGVIVDCEYHVVIPHIQDGVAQAMSGGGPCVVPGHPKSDISLEPPPGAASQSRGGAVTLHWEAVRP